MIKKLITRLRNEKPLTESERWTISYFLEEFDRLQSDTNEVYHITMSKEMADRYFKAFYTNEGDEK